ncbi:hypothetical protein INR49_022763, partial [Caranx melampygus]
MGLTISSLFSRFFGKKQMRILMAPVTGRASIPDTLHTLQPTGVSNEGLIFVVDSNDRERVAESAEELSKM